MAMRGIKRLLAQFAISALVAVCTPAVAAGLVAGASVAVAGGEKAVDNSTIVPNEMDGAIFTAVAPVATHGPTRLSVLAGNDKAAKDSARAVHVNFQRKVN